MKPSIAAQWAALDDHFQHHVRLVERFKEAGPDAVSHMWASQTNEGGKRLSEFEREALIERHCELFGTWPQKLHHLAAFDLRITEGKQRIADQRRGVVKQECLGRDKRLSK